MSDSSELSAEAGIDVTPALISERSELTTPDGRALEIKALISESSELITPEGRFETTGTLTPEGTTELGRALIPNNNELCAETGIDVTPALISERSELTKPDGIVVTIGTLTPDGTTPLETALISETIGLSAGADVAKKSISEITLSPGSELEGSALISDSTGLSTGAFVGNVLMSEIKLLSPGIALEGSPLICERSELTKPEGSVVTTGTLTPDDTLSLGRAQIRDSSEGVSAGALDAVK